MGCVGGWSVCVLFCVFLGGYACFCAVLGGSVRFEVDSVVLCGSARFGLALGGFV